MRLINYKRGFIQRFDCVIHGRIIMTHKEWHKALAYLRRAKDWGYKFMLEKDIRRAIFTSGPDFIVNIRVGATEKLVSHFGIDGYKQGNYWIEVIG